MNFKLLVPLQGYHLNHTRRTPRALAVFTTLDLVVESRVLVVPQLGRLGGYVVMSYDFYLTFLDLQSLVTSLLCRSVCNFLLRCRSTTLIQQMTTERKVSLDLLQNLLLISTH